MWEIGPVIVVAYKLDDTVVDSRSRPVENPPVPTVPFANRSVVCGTFEIGDANGPYNNGIFTAPRAAAYKFDYTAFLTDYDVDDDGIGEAFGRVSSLLQLQTAADAAAGWVDYHQTRSYDSTGDTWEGTARSNTIISLQIGDQVRHVVSAGGGTNIGDTGNFVIKGHTNGGARCTCHSIHSIN